jgi:hypothetical protein
VVLDSDEPKAARVCNSHQLAVAVERIHVGHDPKSRSRAFPSARYLGTLVDSFVVTFQRGIDDREPLRPQPIERSGGRHEKRPVASSVRLAVGTLACPGCDAPVAPPAGPLAPADPLGCGYCLHTARVRDFLSLAAPARPTRVDVWVRQRPRAGRRGASVRSA